MRNYLSLAVRVGLWAMGWLFAISETPKLWFLFISAFSACMQIHIYFKAQLKCQLSCDSLNPKLTPGLSTLQGLKLCSSSNVCLFCTLSQSRLALFAGRKMPSRSDWPYLMWLSFGCGHQGWGRSLKTVALNSEYGGGEAGTCFQSYGLNQAKGLVGLCILRKIPWCF